ncbi:Ig-like domain-containing protein [Aquincola sp. S2]|uniref:Ig-like domain-containing protein n=1 Tax=Pseudaquabacterium terrae TaxID=2732868 RepID=A0ABX2ENW3_9BURK|nr:Ig-like domain-containing protein [Aquabacterium terrae]NRF70347.1 Ig-like domain-containing protein [Aquabacterium terrae]
MAQHTDATAPRLIGTLPADDSSGAYALAPLRLRFDEPVRAGRGTITLHHPDGSLARSFDVRDVQQVHFSHGDVLIQPRNALEPGSTYTLRITPGAFVDAAGNAFAGLTAADAHGFSTEPAATLAIGSSVIDTIDAISDHDLLQLELQAGQAYRFTLAAAGENGLADPALALIDPLGIAWPSVDRGDATNPASITFVAHADGTYYLDVSSAAGGYQGAYEATAARLVDDHPRDATTTGRISVNDSATEAVFDYRGDEDAFRVNLQAGVMVHFELSALDGPVDASLRLTAAEGYLLASGTRSPEAAPVRLTYVPEVSGPGFLKATGYPDTGGAYRITAVVAHDTVPAHPGSPARIELAADALAGHVETYGDVDLYRVRLTAGVRYDFELSGSGDSPLATPLLTLLSPSHEALASGEYGGPAQVGARITHTPATSGAYYLRASGGASDIGSYSIDVREADILPPVAVIHAPGSGSTVHRETSLAFTFSEDLVAGAGDVVLRDASGAEVGRCPATDYRHVSISGSKLRLQPGVELPPESTYYLEIEPGALRDKAGNAFVGWTGAQAFMFTTAADDIDGSVGSGNGRLTVDGPASSGLIEVAGDRDLFAVELQAGATYAFHLAAVDGAGEFDAGLMLYDPHFHGVLSDSRGQTSAVLTYTASSSGTHYLGASGSGSSGAVPYTLEAALLDSAPSIELIGVGA